MATDGRAKARAASRDAALVLHDDIGYMRRLVAQSEPNPGDLRRLSVVLRRLLIDGDLQKVAAPRIERLHIMACDLRKFHRANEEQAYKLLAADEFETHGIIFSAFTVESAPRRRPIRGQDLGEKTALRVAAFAQQKVLCVQGQWVTRAEIIKYVANVAHGVHSGQAREKSDFILQKVRSGLTIHTEPMGPNGELGAALNYNTESTSDGDVPIEFRPNVVDLALLFLISTAKLLTASPDIIALEKEIERAG